MGYIDSTATELGIDPLDPVQAINAAAKQYRERRDNGMTDEQALAAHYGGSGYMKSAAIAYAQDALAKAKAYRKLYERPADTQAATQSKAVPVAKPPAVADESPLDQIRQIADRMGEAGKRGYHAMVGSLNNARYLVGSGNTNDIALGLAEQFKAQDRQKTPGEKEVDAGLQEVTNAKGFWETVVAGGKAIATVVKNPADLATGIVEQGANMLPTIGGGVVGAGGGAATGGAIGSVVPGPGTAAGAATGAVIGGRAGMLAGTAAVEAGSELQQMVGERLQTAKKQPTAENIKLLLDDPVFRADALKRGVIKGLTVGVVDQLFMVFGGKILGAPARKLALTELAKQGVDVSTRKAASEALATAAGRAALEAASPGRAAKAAAMAAATGVDAIGEVAGEALSQELARGNVDKGDALAEGLYGVGQALVEPVIGLAMHKAYAAADAARGGDMRRLANEMDRAVKSGQFQVPADEVARRAMDPNAQPGMVDPNTSAPVAAPIAPQGPISRAAEAAKAAVPVPPVAGDVVNQDDLGGMLDSAIQGGGAEQIDASGQPVPAAEPKADIQAQVDAIHDPSSSKDTALITPNTKAEINTDGLMVLDTNQGQIVTSSPEKAAAIRASNGQLTTDEVGALLGYTTPKSETDGTVVQAHDTRGNVVSEEVTNQGNLGVATANAKEMAPKDGKVVATDAPAALAARAAKIEGQSGRSQAAKRRAISPERDDILAAIAKAGGLSRQDAKAQGIDPAEFNRRGHGIARVFTKNGLGFDGMAEILSQDGYTKYDANELLHKVSRALSGERVMAPQGYERQAAEEHALRAAAEGDMSPMESLAPETSEEMDPHERFLGAHLAHLADSAKGAVPRQWLEWALKAHNHDAQSAINAVDALMTPFSKEDFDYVRKAEAATGIKRADATAWLDAEEPPVPSRKSSGGDGRDLPKEQADNLELTQQTNAEIAAAEATARKTADQKAASERKADQKAKADAESKDFTLTGSDRASDANSQQGDLLSQSRKPKPAAKAAGAFDPVVDKITTQAQADMAERQLVQLRERIKSGEVADFGTRKHAQGIIEAIVRNLNEWDASQPDQEALNSIDGAGRLLGSKTAAPTTSFAATERAYGGRDAYARA